MTVDALVLKVHEAMQNAPHDGKDFRQARAAIAAVTPVARPREEWDEDDGPALWWFFPIVEAPYAGDPREDDFPDYYTHWTPIVYPEEVTHG